MKRFVNGLISNSIVTTAEKITAFEIMLIVLHASYTLDRYEQPYMKLYKKL